MGNCVGICPGGDKNHKLEGLDSIVQEHIEQENITAKQSIIDNSKKGSFFSEGENTKKFRVFQDDMQPNMPKPD